MLRFFFSVLYLLAFGPHAVLVTSEVRSALESSQVRRPVEDATSERSVLALLMGVCVAFVLWLPRRTDLYLCTYEAVTPCNRWARIFVRAGWSVCTCVAVKHS